MTIKDIAKAANVSAATVSRIINHKDENISQETRERVLRVIEENDYVPYAKIRERILSQSRSIGLVIPTLDSAFYVRFASAAQRYASRHNYALVLALSGGSAEAELSSLNDFGRNRTDGVILFSGSRDSSDLLKQMHDQGLAVVTLEHYAKPSGLPQLYRDSGDICLNCTRLLLKNNCAQIGLVLRPDCTEALRGAIYAGYASAVTAAGLVPQQNLVILQDDSFLENFRGMADTGLDGIVCQDADVARAVYAAAVNDELRIPEDICVISMEDAADADSRTPALTAASTDVAQMAQKAFDCLLSQIEHTPLAFSSEKMSCPICQRGSIRMRRSTKPRILVTGYLNVDILLRTPDLPQMGKTQVTAHIADYVGGRGANQAYGISKLGGDVSLMGRLGSDRRGRAVYDHMVHNGVRMDGVSFCPDLPTGTAYISLYPNGKSSVLIDPGANTTLDAAYVRQHEDLVRDADFCLAQTDIPLESITALRDLCLTHQVPMILRPSYGVILPTYLMDGLYILIMKEQERRKLYPEFSGQEECAAYFLSHGAQNVIFTEGSAGCFWACRDGIRRYPGHDYPCIDETGTSDVFIGCLALLLSEKRSLDEAVRAAAWAAAYSTTKLGVQSGFPDRKLLEDVVFGGLKLQFQEP